MGTTAASPKANETLITYVTDMHALISHGLQAIKKQANNLKDNKHQEAFRAVQEFQRTLESEQQLLADRVKATGPLKDAMSALTGVTAGIINALRSEEASKSIRDDYTFLSLVAVSYLMLHTTSKGLGDLETAAIAERGYRHMARLIMNIDRLLPKLVVEELRQDGLTVSDVSEDCRKLVKQAWEEQASGTGMAS